MRFAYFCFIIFYITCLGQRRICAMKPPIFANLLLYWKEVAGKIAIDRTICCSLTGCSVFDEMTFDAINRLDQHPIAHVSAAAKSFSVPPTPL